MKRLLAVLTAGLLIGACGPSPQNDPIYQALLANPPTTIPKNIRPFIRNGQSQCEVFNRDRSDQYMLCWFKVDILLANGTPTRAASVSYYGPSPLNPPDPSKIIARGGRPVGDYVPL